MWPRPSRMFSFARIRFATTRSSRRVPLPAVDCAGLPLCPKSPTVITATAPIVTARRVWFFIRIGPLFEQILYFRDARPRTCVVHFQIRSGAPNRADGVVADLDRHAAAQRENVCEIALRRRAWIL